MNRHPKVRAYGEATTKAKSQRKCSLQKAVETLNLCASILDDPSNDQKDKQQAKRESVIRLTRWSVLEIPQGNPVFPRISSRCSLRHPQSTDTPLDGTHLRIPLLSSPVGMAGSSQPSSNHPHIDFEPSHSSINPCVAKPAMESYRVVRCCTL